jgi:hypothetical protein
VKNCKVKRRLSGLRWTLYNIVDTYVRMVEKDYKEILLNPEGRVEKIIAAPYEH